jgi:hypothetical protein
MPRLRNSTLQLLGRRVERLLYSGVVLLIACFGLLYLIKASEFFESGAAPLAAQLIQAIESDRAHLDALFSEIAKVPPTDARADQREAVIARTRRQLGLPLAEPGRRADAREAYREALATVAITASVHAGASTEKLPDLEASKSPKQLLTELRKEQDELKKKPTTIWGIETPSSLPIHYAGMEYRVPPMLLASALAAAMYLLAVGWLGSLHITRQRELSAIAALTDYRLAFPHILNLLPVVFSELERSSFRTRRGRVATRKINRIALGILRALILLLFSIPLVATIGYSAFVLVPLLPGPTLVYGTSALVLLAMPLMQTLVLLAQEVTLLRHKEFYME